MLNGGLKITPHEYFLILMKGGERYETLGRLEKLIMDSR